MFNQLTGAIVTLQVYDVLETDHTVLSKAERWQLIDRIDGRIDRLQQWQQKCQAGSPAELEIKLALQSLRLKRFQVWNSFYPAFSNVIRVGAYAN